MEKYATSLILTVLPIYIFKRHCWNEKFDHFCHSWEDGRHTEEEDARPRSRRGIRHAPRPHAAASKFNPPPPHAAL